MTPARHGSTVRYGARLVGLVYLGLAVLGFLPVDALNPYHPEGVGARYLLNLVAIDTWHNLVHLAVGLSGIWAAGQPDRIRGWGILTGSVLLLLFAAGLTQAAIEGFPKEQRFLGLLPLNAPGHVLHLMTGGLTLYLGLAVPRPAHGS